MYWTTSDTILKEDHLRTIAAMNVSKWPVVSEEKSLKEKITTTDNGQTTEGLRTDAK